MHKNILQYIFYELLKYFIQAFKQTEQSKTFPFYSSYKTFYIRVTLFYHTIYYSLLKYKPLYLGAEIYLNYIIETNHQFL